MKSDPAYEQLRQQIEREIQAEKARRGRILLRLNMALYVAFLFIAWVRLFPIFDGFWEQETVPSLVMLSIAGLIQVAIHYAAYRLNTSRGERTLREQLLGRAFETAMDADDADMEKPKRRMHLSDEGELVDETDDFEDESLPRVKRR
jgi:hypothetical protein